jgi:hypothetical protein
MNTYHSEIGSETRETIETHDRFDIGRRIESLDDITREIADRRLHSEFGEHIDPERSRLIREVPDRFENDAEFERSARAHGIHNTEGLLGYMFRPEDPAHILRSKNMAERIATTRHEDFHRETHPETLRDVAENAPLKEFYEGVAEYFTQQAMEGLHEYTPGEVYPEQVEQARQLASEVGEQALRDWFFKHELSEELSQAIERLNA